MNVAPQDLSTVERKAIGLLALAEGERQGEPICNLPGVGKHSIERLIGVGCLNALRLELTFLQGELDAGLQLHGLRGRSAGRFDLPRHWPSAGDPLGFCLRD